MHFNTLRSGGKVSFGALFLKNYPDLSHEYSPKYGNDNCNMR